MQPVLVPLDAVRRTGSVAWVQVKIYPSLLVQALAVQLRRARQLDSSHTDYCDAAHCVNNCDAKADCDPAGWRPDVFKVPDMPLECVL